MLRNAFSEEIPRPRFKSDVQKRTEENIIRNNSFLDSIDGIDWSVVGSYASKKEIDSDDEKDLFFPKSGLFEKDHEILPETVRMKDKKHFRSVPTLVEYKDGRRSPSPEDDNDWIEYLAASYSDHEYPMTQITKRLYIGNDHDASNEPALKAAKITHVLSMVGRKWVKKRRTFFDWKRGIKRKCVPMSDNGNTDVTELLEEKRVWSFIMDSQKKKKKLLVHCQLGQNRSPTIVMAFLMKHEQITFHQAWRKVKQKRVIVQPHVKYIKQLRAWDRYLHGSSSTPQDFLEVKVSGEDISVTHEHADTLRMKTVLSESLKQMKKVSTFNKSWESFPMESDWGIPSPFTSNEDMDLLGASSNFVIIQPDSFQSDDENPASNKISKVI